MTYGTEPRRRRWSSDPSRADEADEAENWLAAYRPPPGERAPKSFDRGGAEGSEAERLGDERFVGPEHGGVERGGPEYGGPGYRGPGYGSPEYGGPEHGGADRRGAERGRAERGGPEGGGRAERGARRYEEETGRHGRHVEAPRQHSRHTADDDVPVNEDLDRPVRGDPTRPGRGEPGRGGVAGGLRDEPGRGEPGRGWRGRRERARPASGAPVSGLPDGGLPVSGLPDGGLPVSGLPNGGLPVRGRPVDDDRGRPVSGPTTGDLGRPARGERGRRRFTEIEPVEAYRPADPYPPAGPYPPADQYPPAEPYPPVEPPPVDAPRAGRRRAAEPEYPAQGRRRRWGRADDRAVPPEADAALPPVSGGFGALPPVSGGFGAPPPVSGGFGPLPPVSGGRGPLPPVDRPVSGAARGGFTPLGPRPPTVGRPMAGPSNGVPGGPRQPVDERTNGWAEPGYDEPPVLRPATGTRRGGGRRPDLSRPDVSRPDLGRPDLARTDVARPDVARPDIARPDRARPDRSGPWTDPGTRRARVAERDDLVSTGGSRATGHPRSRLWMGTLVFIGVVVVLAVCALGTYFVVNDERHGPADIRSGASGPPLQKRDISSRAVDPDPLTEAEVFPKPQIVAAANEPPYQVLKTQAAADCKVAATDELGALLLQAGCSQVVRATLKSPNGAYLITTGIFNLTDEAAATQVHGGIKDIVDGQKGRFNGLAAGAGTEAIIRAPTHLGWNVRGHYLAYCVIARTDGQPFANGDAFPQQIIFDLVETHLRDGIVGARAVISPSAGAASTRPSAGG